MTWVVAAVVFCAWAFGVWYENLGPGYERRCAEYSARRAAELEEERRTGLKWVD